MQNTGRASTSLSRRGRKLLPKHPTSPSPHDCRLDILVILATQVVIASHEVRLSYDIQRSVEVCSDRLKLLIVVLW